MNEQGLTAWFADIFAQSEATIALICDQMRKDGERLTDYVIIVADMTDEHARFLIDQLHDGPIDAAMPGFVGAMPKANVARVLRVMQAESSAKDMEKPIDEGMMRVLITARGQVNCADLPAAPLMSRGGSA